MVQEKMVTHMWKSETKSLFLHRKINPKCTKDLSERHETLKLLEEDMGERIQDIGIGNDFFNKTSIA
jgi:hypothetical protein